ncbi:MAG: metallophosphoesterase [Candidatus Daviesbacteria bacterium]|nr:metallophosphoesterase [Candidatus Daviesbacteria bacterium]
MFGRKSEPKKRGMPLPLKILRLFLSFTMLLILGIVVLQAFTYFSGEKMEQDPQAILKQLKSDPQGTILTLISSQQVLTNLSILKNFKKSQTENQSSPVLQAQVTPSGPPILKFAIVSDSHNDNNNLAKALSIAKEKGAKFVVGLGDYTATGTLPELRSTKETFDNGELPYYLTAGDHDLWESREKKLPAISNFNQVFGSPYQSFIDSNTRFVIVDNSDNYEGVSSLEFSWLKDVLANTGSVGTVLVFLHEPLYHPTSDRVVGAEVPKLKDQALELENLLKNSKVGALFAGNIHAYSSYEGKSGLPMYTIGAVTADRNVQLPRFAVVDVYENGSYNVEDIEIK